MINRQYFSKFFLHYGISTVLVIMFISVMYILRVIEINNKVQADLILEHDGNYYCYISQNIISEKQDTVVFYISDADSINLIILEREKNRVYKVYVLGKKEKVFSNGRKVVGYIVIGKTKLTDLIFQKWYK